MTKLTLESIVTDLETSKHLQESGVMEDREPLFWWSSAYDEPFSVGQTALLHAIKIPAWTQTELIEELGNDFRDRYLGLNTLTNEYDILESIDGGYDYGAITSGTTPIQALANLLEAINE